MTRTITGAVHRLYEGTQSVIEGDFSHRIEVTGKDQLAELSHSFNRMTENLEQLLVVAKEKERLQSEIEIAREVQNQLYPRVVPQTRTLRAHRGLPARAHGLRRLLRLRNDPRLAGRAGHRRRGGQRNLGGAADGDAAEFAAHPVAELAGSGRGGRQWRHRAGGFDVAPGQPPEQSASRLHVARKIRDVLPGRLR